MTSLTRKLNQYGDWAVVTGASSGIGKSFAHQLACAGVNVVLVSRSENDLKAVSDELNKKYGVQTRILAMDLPKRTNCTWPKRCTTSSVHMVSMFSHCRRALPRHP